MNLIFSFPDVPPQTRTKFILFLAFASSCVINRVPTAHLGKTGKVGQNIPCLGKDREFGNVAKTQGICFAQVVNSLILKVKDVSIFVAKISNSVLCM